MQAEDKSTASAERVGRNDALFREANERIKDVVTSYDHEESELLPFLCECAEETCTEVVQLTADEYEAVRRHPTRFLNVEGHVRSAQGWARVLEEHDRYTVVDKVGEAAEIAVELDPRDSGG